MRRRLITGNQPLNGVSPEALCCHERLFTRHRIAASKDVRALVRNIDHRTRRLVEPSAVHRPAGLAARRAAINLIR
jgi:hypothetical protein